jgi:hypothetical protein
MRSYIYMCCVEGEEEEEEEEVVEVTECDNENAIFAMPFNTNNFAIDLPRQARDKHS